MRYDHPEIASFADGGRKVYEVPSSTALDRWMEEVFFVESLANAHDLFAKSRQILLPTLHYLPHRSENLFHSSCWRIDGIGALNLLKNFIEALAELRHVVFADEWRNLTPDLSEAAN